MAYLFGLTINRNVIYSLCQRCCFYFYFWQGFVVLRTYNLLFIKNKHHYSSHSHTISHLEWFCYVPNRVLRSLRLAVHIYTSNVLFPIFPYSKQFFFVLQILRLFLNFNYFIFSLLPSYQRFRISHCFTFFNRISIECQYLLWK